MRTLSTNLKPQNQISKAFFLLIVFLAIFTNKIYSQEWCIPVITETFSHGINHVSLNGTPPIERTSGRLENYVYTAVSTTLIRGQQYTVSLTQGFGAFCDAGNLRVWIDFNRDYDFDDSGELVLSLNHQFTTGPFTANFTVPNNAFLGTTRMRVADKMREPCGHTGVTPCNIPPDPIGYHGEMEDYDIIITNPTGLSNISSNVPDRFQLFQNYPNPFNPSTDIKFDVAKSSQVKITVYDVIGQEVTTLVNENLQAGTYKVDWNASSHPSGIYYYKIVAGDPSSGLAYVETRKMVLVK